MIDRSKRRFYVIYIETNRGALRFCRRIDTMLLVHAFVYKNRQVHESVVGARAALLMLLSVVVQIID